VRWPLADHLGTVRDLAVLDDNGTPDDTSDDLTRIPTGCHFRYDAFGNSLGDDTPAAVDFLFGFTGRPFDDDTGLQENQPISKTDPSGELIVQVNLVASSAFFTNRFHTCIEVLYLDTVVVEALRPECVWRPPYCVWEQVYDPWGYSYYRLQEFPGEWVVVWRKVREQMLAVVHSVAIELLDGGANRRGRVVVGRGPVGTVTNVAANLRLPPWMANSLMWAATVTPGRRCSAIERSESVLLSRILAPQGVDVVSFAQRLVRAAEIAGQVAAGKHVQYYLIDPVRHRPPNTCNSYTYEVLARAGVQVNPQSWPGPIRAPGWGHWFSEG